MLVHDLKNPPLGSTLWDKGERGSVKGLHVRVHPVTGKQCYFLYYRTKAGVQRRPKLGDAPETNLAEARARAKALLDQVAVGGDPKGDWDTAKAEMTVSELFEKVWVGLWNTPRYIQSKRASQVKSLWETDLKAEFGSMKLSHVTRRIVKAWHKRYATTAPYAGNRAAEVLSRMFSYAIEEDWVAAGSNPCMGLAGHKEAKRSRYATEEELQKLGPILVREAVKRPEQVAYLMLVMLTGSRPIAIQRATHDQLSRVTQDGKTFGVLTFNGKSSADSGESERLFIPPSAMALIDSLPRRPDNRIVGCSMPRKLWLKIRNEIGAPDLWARDLRRTFATVGFSNGIDKGTVSALLNHDSMETTDRYAKLLPKASFKAVLHISDTMELLLQPKTSQASASQ